MLLILLWLVQGEQICVLRVSHHWPSSTCDVCAASEVSERNPFGKAAVISQYSLQWNNLTSSIGLEAKGWGGTDLVSRAGDTVSVTVYLSSYLKYTYSI